jgi:hypothetical protein
MFVAMRKQYPERRLGLTIAGTGQQALFLILVVLSASLLTQTLFAQAQVNQQAEATVLESPDQSLSQRLSDPQFYEEIANPSLSSKEEVKERITTYEALLDELNRFLASPPRKPEPGLKTKAEQAISLLTRFLDFTKDTEAREIIFIGDRLIINLPRELDQSSKHRVKTIIEEKHEATMKKWKARVNLPLSPGFIFVKLYERRDEMARDYQLGPETAGVAFPCRYIAIALPYPDEQLWGRMKQFFIQEEFKQTVAHEFVHSFCHTAVGFQHARDLPRWFQEGFALYFSGERRLRTAIEGPGGVTIRDVGSTEEYQEFKGLFQFILEKYGEEVLYAFVKTSLREHSVDKALAEVLHLSGKAGLVAAAADWSGEKRKFQERAIFTVACLALLVLGLFRGRWANVRWIVILFIVWVATLHASLTRYYFHTSLWWMPVVLFFPLAHLIFRYVRRPAELVPEEIRLIVERDWPRLDEIIEPWPYEEVSLAEIVESGFEAEQWCGEREFTDSRARRIKDFLDSQPTNFFYFQGEAYRVWYEPLFPGEDEEPGAQEP